MGFIVMYCIWGDRYSTSSCVLYLITYNVESVAAPLGVSGPKDNFNFSKNTLLVVDTILTAVLKWISPGFHSTYIQRFSPLNFIPVLLE